VVAVERDEESSSYSLTSPCPGGQDLRTFYFLKIAKIHSSASAIICDSLYDSLGTRK